MNNRNKLIRRGIKSVVEGLLEDYPHYYEYVKYRVFQLANPVAEIDENVGGGKAQNKINDPLPLRLMIQTEDDRYLSNLRRIHDDIRVCYEEADSDVKTIVKELYFTSENKRKYHTIDALVCDNKIPLSKTLAYQKFDEFVSEVADQLGLGKFK